MPELPEAEITTRRLRMLILGKRILNLGGRKILRIKRNGKAILIYLSGKKLLAFHQRMTGKLLIVPRGFKDKHIRRRFRLSSGKDLVLHDVRKFGVVWYGPPEKVFEDNYFKSLGPDALSVSFAEFKKLFGAKKA
ncbi:MAG: DNA-formamidopyrimidine glycosylase family protein, partial [bacterium]|nr:DNA-formamidopyrimidine glycosylase family protein [bacterium]